MNSVNFNEELQNRITKVETNIMEYLPDEEGYAKTVIEAMNYSFKAGGKRLRPLLMIESHILCGGDGRLVSPFMAALEMIHTYSLVHDDLPAMDNGELRRGKPTTWKQFGDGMAVLAGDGLLNYAMEVACLSFDLAESELDYEMISRALRTMFFHSGIYGMIGGQCADIEAEDKDNKLNEIKEAERLLYIHENKTAALIRSALTVGAILAGATSEVVGLLDRVGFCVGIAFQIQDDILDVTSTDEELGKPVGSDARNEKTTYVSLYGIDAAKEEVATLSKEALDILQSFNHRNEFLENLIEWLIDRNK